MFWPANPPRPLSVFLKTRNVDLGGVVGSVSMRQNNKRILILKESTHPEAPDTCSNTIAKKTLVPTDSHASASATSDKNSMAVNHSELSSEESIDLASITDTEYQSVEGVHGITYRNSSTGNYD